MNTLTQCKNQFLLVFTLTLFLITLAFSQVVFAQSPNDKNAKKPNLPPGQFRTIEWTDLIPQKELDILLNPPGYLDDIEDGSAEDEISNQMTSAIAQAKDDQYQQALASTNIKSEMNDQAVRIPGFIVPLEYDDEQLISEFFLVPYFGACIHMPPPPPNQIIYIKYPKGLKLEALYDPFWITGILKTSLVENDMATAAYSIDMQSYEPY